MLMVSTLYQYERLKNLKYSMFTSGEMSIEKNRKKEELIQNKCVSSQNKQYEKRRGRHRSGYTYLPSQRADATVVCRL